MKIAANLGETEVGIRKKMINGTVRGDRAQTTHIDPSMIRKEG
jgi:hypothetical protein